MSLYALVSLFPILAWFGTRDYYPVIMFGLWSGPLAIMDKQFDLDLTCGPCCISVYWSPTQKSVSVECMFVLRTPISFTNALSVNLGEEPLLPCCCELALPELPFIFLLRMCLKVQQNQAQLLVAYRALYFRRGKFPEPVTCMALSNVSRSVLVRRVKITPEERPRFRSETQGAHIAQCSEIFGSWTFSPISAENPHLLLIWFPFLAYYYDGFMWLPLLKICRFTTLCSQLIYQTSKFYEENPKLPWVFSARDCRRWKVWLPAPCSRSLHCITSHSQSQSLINQTAEAGACQKLSKACFISKDGLTRLKNTINGSKERR